MNKPLQKESKLAIVVPAFKPQYLEQSLTSIARQSDQRFCLYVCDDASPHDLFGIVKNVQAAYPSLRLNFHRFDSNLGGTSLVGQWSRCVAQTAGEPWLWLWSDDDEMDADCVKNFYLALEVTEARYDVYRFNTRTIDASGRMQRLNPPHPAVESSLLFAYHRLRDERVSYATEYLFSRRAYERQEGFVDFPFGWCSDDASWMAFAAATSMHTISGPRVSWRDSHQNVSKNSAHTGFLRLQAALSFLRWIETMFAGETDAENGLNTAMVLQHGRVWFGRQLQMLRGTLPLSKFTALAAEMNTLWGNGLTRNHLKLLRYNISTIFTKN